MSIGPEGQNLIFLISQPRSGSTLLQRMLSNHPAIHTESEPWLMLHPLYALRRGQYQAQYGSDTACEALHGFLDQIESNGGGRQVYFEAVRHMCRDLYNKALDRTDKQYFLDKTPRYYNIIPELINVFPRANFIILFRNPIAVLTSILKTWKKENWFSIYENKDDLILAPHLLSQGVEQLGTQGTIVHYEQLVNNPEIELEKICEKVNISENPAMIEYGQHESPEWKLGDQTYMYRYQRPVASHAQKWQQVLADPQVWRLASDYLDMLGCNLVDQMGYSHRQIQQILDSARPSRIRAWFTLTLPWFFTKPVSQRGTLTCQAMRWLRRIQRSHTKYASTTTGKREHMLLNHALPRVS